jgi:sugar/nucleoside kinase (ribokinase family)
MPEIRHDIVGIGNAIVDIIGRCDDTFLVRHGSIKGEMRLIDAQTMDRLYAEMGPTIELSGGSAANTMVGVASFGGRSAYIGKVADDEFGRIFSHDIRAAGVAFEAAPARLGAPTSRSLVLVTPDGERTMNTFLGVSSQLDDGEIDPNLIASAGILYLEGYLFDRPEAKSAFRGAAKTAAKTGCRVALTLSDGFCVDRHRGEFLDLIRERVDILFANESEITALYQTSSFEEAAGRVQHDARLAILTRGAKGAVIVSTGRQITVPAEPIKAVVDTTGAGDLFAAGFLFGLSSGRDLETAGRLGCLAAAEIIGHIGARPETNLAALARARGLIF